jgi:hypothetical protein
MADRIELTTALKWNTNLPPVDVDVLVAMDDGTVWRVHRDTWVESRSADPCYRCKTTGHQLPIKNVLGWRYP